MFISKVNPPYNSTQYLYLIPKPIWVYFLTFISLMGRRSISLSDPSQCASLILLLLGLLSCTVAYMVMSFVLRSTVSISPPIDLEGESGIGCCKGIPNLELWGSSVKWGTDHKFNSSKGCCKACKAMCSGINGPCLCDTWVFCGDKQACGSKFGECWLKKQKDGLAPEKEDAGSKVMWTSGLVVGRGEGIIGLETKYGTLHIKLYPDCAPISVAYILDLLQVSHCVGCQFYRAEGRGTSWDLKGNHQNNASFGPPHALLQGTLEAQGIEFKKVPTEFCPSIKRGSVAWINAGPEFFISLANHEEWMGKYTVFGSILPEDMEIAEKITQLPTEGDVWNNINVSVLQNPIRLSLKEVQ